MDRYDFRIFFVLYMFVRYVCKRIQRECKLNEVNFIQTQVVIFLRLQFSEFFIVFKKKKEEI